MDSKCLARLTSSFVTCWAAVGSCGLCRIKNCGSRGVLVVLLSQWSFTSSSLGTSVGRRRSEMGRFRWLGFSVALGSEMMGAGDSWMLSFIILDARFEGMEPMAMDWREGGDGTVGGSSRERKSVLM